MSLETILNPLDDKENLIGGRKCTMIAIRYTLQNSITTLVDMYNLIFKVFKVDSLEKVCMGLHSVSGHPEMTAAIRFATGNIAPAYRLNKAFPGCMVYRLEGKDFDVVCSYVLRSGDSMSSPKYTGFDVATIKTWDMIKTPEDLKEMTRMSHEQKIMEKAKSAYLFHKYFSEMKLLSLIHI